jgi:predicted nucleic acid-binding protein
MNDRSFLDTNVLLYLFSGEQAKSDCAEALVAEESIISVQVLNELTAVAHGKLHMPWDEINEMLVIVKRVCAVEPLTVQTHDKGRGLAERYKLSIFDGMIVASALLAGCTILYSEDMQDGLRIDRRLTVRNPFLASRAH